MLAPAGFETVRTDHANAFVRPEARDRVAGLIESGGTLHDAALERAERKLEGRGPVPVIAAGSEEGTDRWAVRHYSRGGWMAGVLGDRYFRLGRSRPVAEAAASATLVELGIPTPPVVAGAVYPAGLFYRADLVTRFVPDSADLATVLFHDDEVWSDRRTGAVEATVELVLAMGERGVFHPDMNAGNVLLRRRDDGKGLDALVLDLDRCSVDSRRRNAAPRMLSRLARSLRKLERRAARPVPEAWWKILEESRGDGSDGRERWP